MVASTRFKFWPPTWTPIPFLQSPTRHAKPYAPPYTHWLYSLWQLNQFSTTLPCLSKSYSPSCPSSKVSISGRAPYSHLPLNRQTQAHSPLSSYYYYFLIAITLFLTCLGIKSAVSVPVSFLRQKALEGWVKWWILCLLHSISHQWKYRTTNLPQ